MKDTFTPASPIILLGCGNMGRALAQGWLAAGLDVSALYIADPSRPVGVLDGVPEQNYVEGLAEVPDGVVAKAIVLAVKPQIMNAVLPDVARLTNTNTLVISVAAGVTFEQMQRGIAGDAIYIRAMPNTPAAVGEGITGFTSHKPIADKDKTLVQGLLSATGQAVWVAEETLIDAVTSVSGSGPAYVFYMVEAMAAAGERVGLDPDTAMKLARQTIIGAGQLLKAEPELPANELRRRVTSPGGTTAAALDVLMAEGGLSALMREAVQSAYGRAKELAD
ncbi:MAG: pyrroline-5-carboxylate reductase [Kordiimonas sp.]